MSESPQRRERRAEFLLLVVVIIWAANYPVIKYGIGALSPFVFNAVRYVAAAAVLAIMLFRRSEWQPVAAGDWNRLLRAGIVANVIYQIAFIVGINLTTAGNAAILLNTSPLWTLFLSARMHREKISRKMWTGMLISVAGVAMIIFGSGREFSLGGTAVYGDVITLGAAALWGLNNNLQKPLLAKYPTLQVTYIMIMIGAIGLALVAVPPTLTKEWSGAHWLPLFVAALSGAISIGIANLFWSMGVKYLGPGRTAIFNNLIPILAFLVSSLTLNEPVTAIHFLGAAVTIAGVWYARK